MKMLMLMMTSLVFLLAFKVAFSASDGGNLTSNYGINGTFFSPNEFYSNYGINGTFNGTFFSPNEFYSNYGINGTFFSPNEFYSNYGINGTFNGTFFSPNEFYSNYGIKPVKPPAGTFFNETAMKEGNVMPLPDIRDKIPRTFLPRYVLKKTLQECNRAPRLGEAKKCLRSMEQMREFAAGVLGGKVVVRRLQKVVKGSMKEVLLGAVKAVNVGKITPSVSCHRKPYPHTLYYCHSVGNVRMYIAEMLDVKSKEKINIGPVVCHVDLDLCHWIFEGDMVWSRAD